MENSSPKIFLQDYLTLPTKSDELYFVLYNLQHNSCAEAIFAQDIESNNFCGVRIDIFNRVNKETLPTTISQYEIRQYEIKSYFYNYSGELLMKTKPLYRYNIRNSQQEI